jgi:hypothetical protein
MSKRWGAVGGIVAAVCLVVGNVVFVVEDVGADTNREILSYYRDSGNRTAELIAFFVVSVGVLLFLWFASTLRSTLAGVEPEPRTLSRLGFATAVMAAALMIGAAALLVATSVAVEYSSRFVVDANLARFSVSTAYLFLVGWVLANCVLIAITSVLAFRGDVLPSWLGWVGFAAVVLAIAEMFLYPVFAVPVWILVVSIVLLRRRAPDVLSVGGQPETANP